MQHSSKTVKLRVLLFCVSEPNGPKLHIVRWTITIQFHMFPRLSNNYKNLSKLYLQEHQINETKIIFFKPIFALQSKIATHSNLFGEYQVTETDQI